MIAVDGRGSWQLAGGGGEEEGGQQDHTTILVHLDQTGLKKLIVEAGKAQTAKVAGQQGSAGEEISFPSCRSVQGWRGASSKAVSGVGIYE